MKIIDSEIRHQALNPSKSFIVQAPAGSGKTELLTQRFLRLLSTVKEPENIIAITFTRKAAAEMHARIMLALTRADQNWQPMTTHQIETHQLALAALDKAKKCQWQLLLMPDRLQIYTIDGLCARLAKRLPLNMGYNPNCILQEDPEKFYQQAVQNVLLKNNIPHLTSAIQSILSYFDNRYQSLETLLIQLLEKRDQWLGYTLLLSSKNIEETFFESWNALLTEKFSYFIHSIRQLDVNELKNILLFAANHLCELSNNHLSTLEDWQQVANWLLTEKNQWRKSFNIKQGFPAPTTAREKSDKILFQNMKLRMQNWLDANTTAEFLNPFIEIKKIPLSLKHLSWELIDALLLLLPNLAAELDIVFQQFNACDFIAIQQRALMALGDQSQPSDVALLLDEKLHHLLIDEFQDTALQQFTLIEKLTADWQMDDGRTLFLVGDPMQSIYRFRKAEVSLFHHAASHGIGSLKLQLLNLSCNFRSSETLVDWYNQAFSKIFPANYDTITGSVPFYPAVATQKTNGNINIEINSSAETEALQVIELIKHYLAENKDYSIGILVQARNHLKTLLPLLQKNQIAFDATNIAPLDSFPVIHDLLSLTLALLYPADRVSWLALLRTPFIGLSLNDIYLIANTTHSCIWTSLISFHQLNLSDDAKQRLIVLTPILQFAMERRDQVSWPQLVYETWIACGGAATLTEISDKHHAEQYFQLLSEHFAKQDHIDIHLFSRVLTQPVSTPSTANNAVKIMTIHKSKGLEFDIVIIPGLHHEPRAADSPIWLWFEYFAQGSKHLLVSPKKSHSHNDDEDSLYQYFRDQESEKSFFERQRLFYVATTRAKKHLHLLAVATVKDDEWKLPNQCLFALLPNHQQHFTKILESSPLKIEKPLPRRNGIARIKKAIQDFYLLPDFQLTSERQLSWPSFNFFDRGIGIVIHECLRLLCDNQLNVDELLKRTAWLDYLLKQNGVFKKDIPRAKTVIKNILLKIKEDSRATWLLKDHQDAQNEWAITYFDGEFFQHYVIDRTFIDEHNRRVIIDYKIVFDAHDIIKQMPKYQQQLQHYATALSTLETRTTLIALYFPIQNEWIEHIIPHPP